MSYQVLSAAEIEHFIERGYVVLRGAFDADDAAMCREELWRHVEEQSAAPKPGALFESKMEKEPAATGETKAMAGVEREDRATWNRPVVHLAMVFGNNAGEEMFARCWTPRLKGALEDVMGRDRFAMPRTLGWWPVAFPGHFAAPWKPPTRGWHVDGIQFHHHLDSPDQGLLPLFILSEIRPGDGGTAIWEGSHRVAARILQESQPDGLDVHELTRRVLERVEAEAGSPADCVREMTGQPGDAALLHPFMLHARSDCVADRETGRVRFICNPCINLNAPMNFDDQKRDLSPVEIAIKQGIEAVPIS